MRRGQRLYVDVTAYQWPGVFTLAATAFSLFGPSIAVARAITFLVFAVAATATYRIARWSMNRPAALGVVAAFLAYRVWAWPQWQILGYAALAMSLALVAMAATGTALARGGMGRLAVAGVVAGCAALVKQDSGPAMAAMLTVAVGLTPPPVGIRRLARMAVFAAGVAVAVGAGLAPWLARGLATDLVRETLLAPLHGATHFDYLGWPPLRPLLAQDPVLRRHAFSYLPSVAVDLAWLPLMTSRLWRDTPVIDVAVKLAYHLPWFLVLVSAPLALREARAPGPPARPLLVVWCAAVASVLAFNLPRDWAHLVVLYPPILLLAATLAARWLAGPGAWRRMVRRVAWSTLLAVVTLSAWMGTRIAARHDTALYTPRGVLWVPASQASSLQAVIDVLGTRPGVPLLALPYHPLLGALTDRPFVSRWALVWPVDRSDDRDAGIVQALDALGDDVDVVYAPMQMSYGPRPPEYAPALFEYLARRWRVARVVGGDPGGFTFFVLERAEPPTGTSLLPRLEGARVEVEPATGPARTVEGAARAGLVGTALWPVRHVLRMSTLPDAAVAVAFTTEPGPTTRFLADVVPNPDRLGTGFVQAASASVAVAAPGEPEREVFAATLDPAARPA